MLTVSRKTIVELVKKTIITEMMSSSRDQSVGVTVQEPAQVVVQCPTLLVSLEVFTW
jgi:hypothetical protein